MQSKNLTMTSQRPWKSFSEFWKRLVELYQLNNSSLVLSFSTTYQGFHLSVWRKYPRVCRPAHSANVYAFYHSCWRLGWRVFTSKGKICRLRGLKARFQGFSLCEVATLAFPGYARIQIWRRRRRFGNFENDARIHSTVLHLLELQGALFKSDRKFWRSNRK